MTKYVYDFSEGNKDMKDLLGGKGANLAEMTNMGLPVPHGFTITAEACLAYLAASHHPEGLLDEVKERKGRNAQDTDLDADDLRDLISQFLRIYEQHTGSAFPSDPREQLRLAIEAVFKSWNGRRAIDYRRQNKISDDLGTAVNVVAMVFGNRGMDSGTGVAFTRDPATGERVAYGDYLPNAQGEDVVAGIRNTLRLQELADLDPKSYSELREAMDTLEGITGTRATSSSRSR